MDKSLTRIEAKLDALLEKQGIKPADFAETKTAAAPAPRELTELEQQAIDNAPKTPVAEPPATRGPRVTATNAPDTSSSVPTTPVVPRREASSVPPEAVGSVTVETKEPGGHLSVDTMSADEARRKR